MIHWGKARSSKYHPVMFIGVVLTALIAGYLLARVPRNHRPAGPPEKVTIAYSATTDAVLAEVALVQGYCLKEGLEVTPHRHGYGKAALEEVLKGKADFATVAETPVMFAIMKGEKISIVATIQTSSKNAAIVARKDKGIFSPGDLKGKKIGVTSGTTADFFIDAFLASHGISRKQVKVVDLKPEEMLDAINNGGVDAVSAFNPYLIRAKKELGGRGVTFYDQDIYTQTFNIVAKQEFIRSNPGKVKKMLLALIAAEEFVEQNPAEAQKIVADFSRLDSSLVREIWGSINSSVELDQSLVLALEDESRWAIKSGLIGRITIPNYLDFIYFDGLESVKPKAVRILR